MKDFLQSILIVAVPVALSALFIIVMEDIESQDIRAAESLKEAGFSNPRTISITQPKYTAEFGSCLLEFHVDPDTSVISFRGMENTTAQTLLDQTRALDLDHCLL